MKWLSVILVATIGVTPNVVAAGTVEGNVDLPFDKAYPLIQEALKYHYGADAITPYKGEGKSIDLKRNDYDCWDYEQYKKYVLPAYIYSAEAQARVFYIVNVREVEATTTITVTGFWEIETDAGWLKIESNGENEKRFLNFLIAYCNDPSKYE